MKITRVSISSALELSTRPNRSAWVRELLEQALSLGLTPCAVPLQSLTTFTVTLRNSVAEQIEAMAQQCGQSVPVLVAGLVESAHRHQTEASTQENPNRLNTPESLLGLPGIERVRHELLPLLKGCAEGLEDGRIVFAEAATGVGKGRMIASLAADAALRTGGAVISAPLAIVWGLLEHLSHVEACRKVGVGLLLGRVNFVSPQRLLEWANERENTALIQWIEQGGKPLSEKAKAAQQITGMPLRWLLEDALSLDADLPIDEVALNHEDDNDCLAQQTYLECRNKTKEVGIVLCSHHLLAAHIKNMILRGSGDSNGDDESNSRNHSLPDFISALIVDEAHLLEQAFSSIYTNTLRLRPLMRLIDEYVTRHKRPALEALSVLADLLKRFESNDKSNKIVGRIDDFPELKEPLQNAYDALLAAKPTKNAPNAAKLFIQLALKTIANALSGYDQLRVDFSPVRRYPMLLSGRSSLLGPLTVLWDSVAGAVLTSATLFGADDNPSLIRWTLEVPSDRAMFLPSIHPSWLKAPVRRHLTRAAIEPDDSPQWAAQTAQVVTGIAEQAVGGTLVLCTSYLNASQLAANLNDLGDRLIVQTPALGAAACIERYRKLYHEGKRPVWVALGAAWTGIDLSDDCPPEQDNLLSDLVITRLPIGLNRSFTHERRVAVGGFRIVYQEAVWHLRQGIGRLVRRQGVPAKNLFVLDARLESAQAWVRPFNVVLAGWSVEKTA